MSSKKCKKSVKFIGFYTIPSSFLVPFFKLDVNNGYRS